MKKNIYIIILLLTLNSCEDVIDLKVPIAEPRLVIDASLNWFNNSSGEYQYIKLSQSAPFFDNQNPPALGAIVTVNKGNTTYNFTDTNDNGIYECIDFNPEINAIYSLTIIYNNETYIATESMKSVTPIDFIEQQNDGGFEGDEIEIKAFYTDPADQENYYLFEFQEQYETLPNLDINDDRFTNGNQIFSFYSNPDTETGNQLSIKNYGVSKQFYEFMFLLLQQTGEGGGPFQVQPATVRGNCINLTNPENYPFGYFRASQATQEIYIIQ